MIEAQHGFTNHMTERDITVLAAIEDALMRNSKLLVWKSPPIRTWKGTYMRVPNWDYREMARTAYDAVHEVLTGVGGSSPSVSGGATAPVSFTSGDAS